MLYCAVQAVNRHGSGPLSDIMVGPELYCCGYSYPCVVQVGRTQEAAPQSPPQQVECGATSPTSLHLKWRAPPPDSWNGQIKATIILVK